MVIYLCAMKILVVAATESELNALNISELQASTAHDFEMIVTGVGMVATTFYLTKHLEGRSYDAIINIGIAGSFNDQLKNGDVVEIVEDGFGDCGAEDNENFLSLFELQLAHENDFPFKEGKLFSSFDLQHISGLKKARGITVNKVHGHEASIGKIKSKWNADVESMEGAAVFFVAHQFKIPCAQLRAVSNKIEKRNRDAWEIPLALKNLSQTFSELMTAMP